MVISSTLGLVLIVFAFTAPSTIEDVFFPGSQEHESGRFYILSGKAPVFAQNDFAIEAYFNWSGSMMAQAARDPIYEACLAR